LAEGTSLGSEITVGRRYIGRAPDASFVAALELLGAGGEARIIGDLNVAAASEPVVLGVSVSGAVANARRLPECANLACGVSDVAYDYRLSVGGETLSGTSRCREPTCSVGGRRHEVATSDTNKFFANLQGVNLLNPIVLGGAYAQMLQGAAVGAGHKINF